MNKRFRNLVLKTLKKLSIAIIEFRDSRFDIWEREFYTRKWNQQLSSVGTGFMVDGKVDISHPKSLIVGDHVKIGKRCTFGSFGGILIGDYSEVMHDVCIYSFGPDKGKSPMHLTQKPLPAPVVIGKHVVIEPYVKILPGVRIGDHTVVRMGAVINQDIPPGSEVFPAAQELHTENNHGEEPIDMKGKEIFFILSTGRAGSSSITAMLNKHPQIHCSHEPKRPLVRLSTEYYHQLKNKEQVKAELYDLFRTSGFHEKMWYGECDTKFVNLVPVIDEIFPNAKYIWLIRKGEKVVSSTFGREWYWPETETHISGLSWNQIKGMDTWHFYRVKGDEAGVVSHEEWKSMSPWAKNCWYWTTWNDEIEKNLEGLKKNKWMMVKLEELQEKRNEILDFLGVEAFDISLPHENRTSVKRPPVQEKEWTPDQKREFEYWCGRGMKKWYGN